MLAAFSFYHVWMVAAYALLAAGLHVLMLLWLSGRMGAPWPAWARRFGLGVCVLAVAGLALGGWRREQLMAGLRPDLQASVQAVCREAAGIVTRMGGDDASQDEALRARIEPAVREYFKAAVRERFAHTRYAPVDIVSAGKKKTGDFVLGLSERDGDPVHIGCYNQYQRTAPGAHPYWRFERGQMPKGSMVLFVQERRGGQLVVSYPAQ